jgi:hypothetical protein
MLELNIPLPLRQPETPKTMTQTLFDAVGGLPTLQRRRGVRGAGSVLTFQHQSKKARGQF